MPSSSTSADPSARRSRPKPRQGAAVSTRQIAQTVKDGRQVTFTTVVGTVTGYVGGMDDYHWLVVNPENLATTLVHKTAALISLHGTSMYGHEPNHEDLEQIIAPFRNYVLKTYFGHSN